MTIFISPSAGGDNACEACHHTDRSCFALRCSAALDRQTANYRRTTKYDCSESARLRRLFKHQCRDGSLARQPASFCGLVAVTAQDAAIAMRRARWPHANRARTPPVHHERRRSQRQPQNAPGATSLRQQLTRAPAGAAPLHRRHQCRNQPRHQASPSRRRCLRCCVSRAAPLSRQS